MAPIRTLASSNDARARASIDEALESMAEEFEVLGDWEERYRHVIDLGRHLAPLTDDERSEANKVRGCASQVWLIKRLAPDERLKFRGDSDAHIVRGLIAILLALYSDRSPSEILAFEARPAFERLGLVGALSAQRSNGLFSMVERIRKDAADQAAQACETPSSARPAAAP
ncbi:MAG: SufE family protein [Caulobacteraceae bacterium]